jgi:hypothetical protein
MTSHKHSIFGYLYVLDSLLIASTSALPPYEASLFFLLLCLMFCMKDWESISVARHGSE